MLTVSVSPACEFLHPYDCHHAIFHLFSGTVLIHAVGDGLQRDGYACQNCDHLAVDLIWFRYELKQIHLIFEAIVMRDRDLWPVNVWREARSENSLRSGYQATLGRS